MDDTPDELKPVEPFKTLFATLNKVVSHQLEIDSEFTKEISSCKKAFTDLMIRSSIAKANQLVSKDELAEIKAEASKTFYGLKTLMVKPSTKSSEEDDDEDDDLDTLGFSRGKLDKLAAHVVKMYQLLDYLGDSSLRTALNKVGADISVPKLETADIFFAAPEIKDEMANIIKTVKADLHFIDDRKAAIRENGFDALPDGLVYDAETSPNGLTFSNFLTLVKNLKNKLVKQPDTFMDFIKKQVDGNGNSISRLTFINKVNHDLSKQTPVEALAEYRKTEKA